MTNEDDIPDDAGEQDDPRSIVQIMEDEGIDAAVREHVRRRKAAYVKMGIVDIPPEDRD